jgi:hypothetical protein
MLVLYRHYSLSWGWFAALFLIPDLAMLGYVEKRERLSHGKGRNTRRTIGRLSFHSFRQPSCDSKEKDRD